MRNVAILLCSGMLLGGMGCGSKAPPVPLSAAGAPVELLGTWWLLAGPDGPVLGRLTVDGRDITTTDAQGRDAVWSFSADAPGWELRGDQGQVLRAEPGRGGLVLYDARGNYTIAAPVVALPGAMTGRWRERDPASEIGLAVEIRAGTTGSQPTLTKNSITANLWPISLGDAQGWVVENRGGTSTVQWRHPLPGGAWALTTEQPAKFSVLHRADGRPSWVVPEP